MENFSTLFMRLKKERGLSNKQIASFTGANLKEVKKWDAGTSFPTDKKIIIALEGLLGKEVMETLEDLTNYEQRSPSSENIEDSLFTVDRDKKVELKSGFFNRFKSDKEQSKEKDQVEDKVQKKTALKRHEKIDLKDQEYLSNIMKKNGTP